jgi:hypothetical protein
MEEAGMRARRLLPFALIAALALAAPVAAAEPVPPDDHGHGGGQGSSEGGSFNLKHTANLPRPTNATQTDLAFRGNIAIAGSSDGFRVVNIEDQNNPVQISRMACNGSQGDVSVYGNLVFRSVDTPQSSTSCTSTNVSTSTPGAWEGIQIFDISDLANPVKIANVRTDCGSHTNTLVPDEANDQVFLYISSYPLGASQGPQCQLPGGFISIVRVPLSNPAAATVSKYFLDPGTQPGNYLGSVFTACHDISVFMAIKRAAAACMTEGQIWDISNPAAPVFLRRYDNPAINPANIDLFHSAAFSWDGEIVAFGDESGGGGAARCVNPDDNQGRIWFVDVGTMAELASFKIPRSVPTTCTMHNFNFVPQKHGQYTLVSSAYTGGTTVVDVNHLLEGGTSAEAEIAWKTPEGGNSWSTYWYNGRIYANDILRGLDVFNLRSGATSPAVKLPYSNPQTQIDLIN